MNATNTGMTRKLDLLGRIVLPVEIRRLYKIENGDYLGISVSEGQILLTPPNTAYLGMTRKVDELGRIVLPIEIRRSLGIENGDYIGITTSDGQILLIPQNKCICCGISARDSNLVEVKDIRLCYGCLSRFNKAKREGAPSR